MSRKAIIINNFIGGISWGLGATIGVSLLLTLIALLAEPLSLVPIFGDFFARIFEYATRSLTPQS